MRRRKREQHGKKMCEVRDWRTPEKEDLDKLIAVDGKRL